MQLVDRAGTLVTVLHHAAGGALASAWVRIPDGSWLGVEPRAADKVAAVLKREGEKVIRLGELVAAAKGKPRVTYVGKLKL